jgi:predicted O-methyltransferase YrrM
MPSRLRILWSLRGFLAGQLTHVARLPPSARAVYLRALLLALRRGEAHAFIASASPEQVRRLLELASGREQVAELGTGVGLTAMALAAASSRRRVITLDPYPWEPREHYLALLPDDARRRVELRVARGEEGARARDEPVQLLFIDSSHEHRETVASFRAWQPALAPGALTVFHDYANPDYPGVAAAVRELGLSGEERCGMFVWTAG